jgi:ketosteroid isomerase-like protein
VHASASPTEVLDRLLRGINRRSWTDMGVLYADDAVVEQPMRHWGSSRLVGREQLREHFASAAAGPFSLRAHDVLVHETADPEVIVAEFTYEGRVAGTGREFTCANVQVLRVRDGVIVHSRDYHDYFTLAGAVDGLAGLKSALENLSPGREPGRPLRPAAPPEIPRGVFERLVSGISAGHFADVIRLYAEDAVVTHPFHPLRPRPLRGHAQLRDHFAGAAGIELEPRNAVVHETVDPEVVVAEFEYHGTSGIGRPFIAENVFVLRVRRGRIVESRDYADHLALVAASGRLDELVTP